MKEGKIFGASFAVAFEGIFSIKDRLAISSGLFEEGGPKIFLRYKF
jgi:hypothetical protein